MKKISAILTCVLVMISAYIPLCYAYESTSDLTGTTSMTDETALTDAAAQMIEYIDIDYTLTAGEKINDTELKISASKTSLATDITDMTDQFEIGSITWCKVEATRDETLPDSSYYEYSETATEFYLICTDEDTVDETATYKVFIEDVTVKDGTEFNLLGDGKVLINNTAIGLIEDGAPQFDSKNFSVSFKTNVSGPIEKVIETEATSAETIPETVSETTIAAVEETTQQKCSLCGVCPFQPQGVCLFVWIGIIVVGIVVILILVMSIVKKDED